MPTITEAVRAIQPHIPLDNTSTLNRRALHNQPTSGIDRMPPELLSMILSDALVSFVDWTVFAQVNRYWFAIVHSLLYALALEDEGGYQLNGLLKKIKGFSNPETARSILTLEGRPIEPHARLFRPICELAAYISSRQLHKGPVISAFRFVLEGADRVEGHGNASFQGLIKIGQIRRLFGCDAASVLRALGISDQGNAKTRIDEMDLSLEKIYFFREHASLILGLAQQKAFNFPAWLALPEPAQRRGLTNLLEDVLKAPKDSPQLDHLKQMMEKMLRNRLFFISHRNTQPNSVIWLMTNMRQSVDISEYRTLSELENWLIQFVQASAHPSLFPGISYDQLDRDPLARVQAMFNSTEEKEVLTLFSDAIRGNRIELAKKWIACFSHSKWMRAYFYGAFLEQSMEMGKEKLVHALYKYEPTLKPEPPASLEPLSEPPALPESLEQLPEPLALPESPESLEHAQSPLENTTDQPIARQGKPSASSELTIHASGSEYSQSTILHLQSPSILHDQAEDVDLQVGSMHFKYSIRNVLFLGKFLSRAQQSHNEDDRKRAERLKEKMHSHAPWGLGWLVKLSIALSAGFFSYISLVFQSTSF